MSSINELHQAIIKCQFALVRKLASELRSKGVDISGEIAFANKLLILNGGSYKKVVDALG